MWKNQSKFGYNTVIKNFEIMKKIVLLISLVIAAATLNAQDFYIGGGFDKAFIVYPDNSVKD